MKKIVYIIFAAVFVLSTSMCKRNYEPKCDGTNSTYNSNMKAIIDSKCLSCHDSYTSYANISKDLKNGSFKKHVLIEQDMPQGSKLTKDQLDKIQCWSDNGFPEK